MKAPQGSARDSSRVCLRVPTSLSTTVPPAQSPPLTNFIAYAVHRTRHIRGSLSLPTPQRATGCISRTFSCPLRPLSCPPPRTRTQDAAAPSTSLLECVPTTVPVHAGAPPAVLGLVVAPHSHYLETCRRPRRPGRPSGITRSRRERCGRRLPHADRGTPHHGAARSRHHLRRSRFPSKERAADAYGSRSAQEGKARGRVRAGKLLCGADAPSRP